MIYGPRKGTFLCLDTIGIPTLEGGVGYTVIIQHK
jgi:hypothetical protein